MLLASGNIPVERKSKDRQVLFRGTVDALARGWAVALFPEGTSYTEPKIVQVNCVGSIVQGANFTDSRFKGQRWCCVGCSRICEVGRREPFEGEAICEGQRTRRSIRGHCVHQQDKVQE
jgi:1-acyl-sn-glycerol-3-phosphate acyltransferase